MKGIGVRKARGGVVENLVRRRVGLGCGGDASRSGLTSVHCHSHSYDCVCTYLLYPRSQEASNKELEPLEFRLDDDQLEIRLRVHVAGLVFDQFNLPTS